MFLHLYCDFLKRKLIKLRNSNHYCKKWPEFGHFTLSKSRRLVYAAFVSVSVSEQTDVAFLQFSVDPYTICGYGRLHSAHHIFQQRCQKTQIGSCLLGIRIGTTRRACECRFGLVGVWDGTHCRQSRQSKQVSWK